MEQQQPLEKRVTRRGLFRFGKEATKVAAGSAIYHTLDQGVTNLLAAYQSGKRLAQTLTELGMGNEAVRELRRLEHDIRDAEQTLDQRGQEYRAIHERKRGVLEQLDNIYKENETFIRQAVTVSRQLEVLLGDIGNAGESVKPDWFTRNIDDPIYELIRRVTGENSRERHELINRYHGALRDAYRNNENMQRTITDFLTYLRDESRKSAEQIKVIDENFPELTRRLRDNYTQMHELEDRGQRATQELTPQVARLREQIEAIHAELRADGVQTRQLLTGREITGLSYLDAALANTYSRHTLGTLAGVAVVTGTLAVADHYLGKPLKFAYGAAKYLANKAREKNEP
ncbi:hypothetical protein HY489_03845 [Candidatus Woesearchaeota archaeon]|nr:hypothetical protein [Candidatus Woesearchaeota archaeon]